MKTKLPFKIEMVKLKSVKLWKDNPRSNEAAVVKLAKLLKVHGVRTPIVVWEKNKVIYKGNTTYKAAKSIGLKEVPVIYAKFKNEAQAVSYGLSDNKSSEWSNWNKITLMKLLEGKEKLKLFSKTTGFTEKDIEGLQAFKEKELDENIETECECPKCGYVW